jgi:hypothetical protein
LSFTAIQRFSFESSADSHSQDLVLFHRRICKDAKFVGKPRAEHIVPKVAHFMRHFKDSSFSLSLTALTSIAKNVFGDPSRAQHLYESIHSYGLFQGEACGTLDYRCADKKKLAS